MDIKSRIVVSAVFAAVVSSSAFGGWELSVGPAWRSRAKSRISGSTQVTPPPASFSVTYDKVLPTLGWTGAEPEIVTVTDPVSSLLTYAATATRTETAVTPGSASGSLDSSDSDDSMGLKADATWNFYEEGALSVGVNFRFAAYWGMRSTVYGSAGGSTTVSTYTDYFLFSSGPYPPTVPGSPLWPLFPLDATPSLPLRTPLAATTAPHPASAIRARITGDLYQLGVGPRISYCAFDWLEAYAGAAALCNISHVDFEVNGGENSATCCRLGAGGEVGAIAWMTDNLGLYAEVGYEWIDEADAKVGGAKAKTDFSSLVVSAGVVIGF